MKVGSAAGNLKGMTSLSSSERCPAAPDAQDALWMILEHTATQTGQAFFQALAQSLAPTKKALQLGPR